MLAQAFVLHTVASNDQANSYPDALKQFVYFALLSPLFTQCQEKGS